MHTPTSCDQCGQIDTDPKIHYALETFHHDCAPLRITDVLGGNASVAIAAAKAGIRGEALRAHIEAAHEGTV